MSTQRDLQFARRFPVFLLTLAVAVTGIVLGWLIWRNQRSFQTTTEHREQRIEFEELIGRLEYIDEVLTMSARMAVETGDNRWQQRYARFEPALVKVISDADQLAPDESCRQALAELSDANDALVRLERRAFALLEENRLAEARDTLANEEYAALKRDYSAARSMLQVKLVAHGAAMQTADQQRALYDLVAVAVALSVLIGGWLVVLVNTRRWHQVLVQTNEELSDRTRELEELNRNLDERVADRREQLVISQKQLEQQAVELEKANQELKNEIAERALTQQALKNSEALYSSLVENLPVHVTRKDLKGAITYVNKTFCELIGMPPEEIVGKTDYDFYPPPLAQKYQQDDRKVADSGQVFEDIEENQSDGVTRYFHVLKAPVHDAAGQTIGTQAMFWDVTERKRAEDALEYERSLLDTLMRTTPDNIYFKDAEGVYIRVNRAKAKRSGLKDPQEAVGKSDYDFFPEEHARRAKSDERRVMQTGEPIVGKEERLKWPDGTVSWVSSTKMPLRDKKGNVFGTFGISRDITGQKATQEDLRKAKEHAEAASRAKSEFLANVSHEIRTPLNAIIGMAELILDTSLNNQQREYLEIVQESGESLLSVINDILDFSKIEAGRLELVDGAFGLRESLGDTMKSLAVRAHGKPLELVCHIPPDLPEMLVGDVVRLRQVVVNLVGNAVKFTDEGEVVLAATVESRVDGGIVLQFSVSDTGIGIPTEKLSHIFGAFEQVDASTTRRYGGTGLGLAISSRLVELMGGRIWAESIVAQGSTFHFTVPFRLPDVEHVADVPVEPDSLRGLRVLVVDDNATNRLILEEMLSSWEMRPTAVADAPAALEALHKARLENEPFSLLLCDVNMPDVDGFSLIGKIRESTELECTVVLMLTSGDRQGDTARCEELQIPAYLMKPVKQSELFDAILLALGVGAAADVQAEVTIADDRPSPRSLRILLAEDSLANQKLAIGLLEKWGHSVTVANNGKEAVAAAHTGAFDLLLMDVQMPEMDGLEATATIRRQERRTGKHIPIVAMTAHVMKGDREQCLAAGMDGYVSKPIRAQQLHDTITAFFTDSDSAPPQANRVATVHSGRVDWSAAMQAVGGDRELLAGVIEAFLGEAPTLLDELQSAVERGDAATVHRTAHTVKGASRTFAAGGVGGLAHELERMGRDSDLDNAPEKLVLLKQEIELLLKELAAFTQLDNSAAT